MDCARPLRRGRFVVMLAVGLMLGWGAGVQGAPLADEPPQTEPPPAEGGAPPAAPVTPLPSSAPAPGPGYVPAPTDPAMAAPAAAPVVVATPAEPFYVKWWFWTAVGALAVATVVILAASSDSGPPRTNLGNMPAF